MINILKVQGRKSLELTKSELVYVGEMKTGTSQRTGLQWKMRVVTIKFSLGVNEEGEEETMVVAARCLNEVCDRISMVAIGTKLHAYIRLDVNTHFKTPQTDCTLIDFTF